MTLRCLFVDFDSFFASVEQHDDARLRGRPVAVVPVASKTTCCIAASKEAKRDYDIKTGTGVAEALERCPDLALRLARRARFDYQRSLGRAGGVALATAARMLGGFAFLLAVTGALALGVFAVLTLASR